jgi:hypothetical protein
MRGLDNWITTTPEDLGHDYYCACAVCHLKHRQEYEVEANAETPDFPCCREEIEDRMLFVYRGVL